MHKRKNALFAGSDDGGDHWAVIATLIETAKLNDVNPHTWLADTLQRLAGVKRRSKGTPDRRRRGTPFSDNMMLVC